MALLTAVAGAYTGSYTPGAGGAGTGSSYAQGILTDDGYRLVWTTHAQRIGNDGTDQYGNTLLINIYRGADWSLIYRCREYAANNLNATWPWGKVSAALSPALGVIGRLANSGSGAAGGQIVLTAVSGTPAAAAPATLTAADVAAADGVTGDLSFTSKLREVPVHLLLFPYTSGGDKVWFTCT